MNVVTVERGPYPDMIEQILAGAERAFLASGFDLATMESVARHSGVARASVYNNYRNKEALFLAVMQRGVTEFVARATTQIIDDLPPSERLRQAAITFLHVATEREATEMYRTVVAQSVRFPELSRTLHNQGLMRIESAFRTLADDAGIVDPAGFAEQLLAALMGGYFSKCLLGATPDESPEAFVGRALRILLPSLVA